MSHQQAIVDGFTITGGESSGGGAGVHFDGAGLVANCRISLNSAISGGAVFFDQGGTLQNCVVSHNQGTAGIWYEGGGTVRNCTVVANEGYGLCRGSGAAQVVNTIIRNNLILDGSGFYSNCIISDPSFVNEDAGDYRLLPDSPCVDAGTNAPWMAGRSDLEGKPRILNGVVDVGAYELLPRGMDSDGDAMPDWWEWQHWRDTTNGVPEDDDDGDGMNNHSELVAGTDPVNFLSSLDFVASEDFPSQSSNGFAVSWRSVAERRYRLLRSTNLIAGFDYVVDGNILATPPMNTQTDNTATGAGPWFYRVQTGLE